MRRNNRPSKKKQIKVGESEVVHLPLAKARDLVAILEKTREVELPCDQVHDLVAQFAEMDLRGEDTAHLLPLVHQHLELCTDCRDEFEALIRILIASNLGKPINPDPPE